MSSLSAPYQHFLSNPIAKPPCRMHNANMYGLDRKSTRLNSSHGYMSYAVFCLKKKNKKKKVALFAHGTYSFKAWDGLVFLLYGTADLVSSTYATLPDPALTELASY